MIKNHTNLVHAEKFIRMKLEQYDTSKLKLHLKYTKSRTNSYDGYCRYKDFYTVAAINEELLKLRLPFEMIWAIGTEQVTEQIYNFIEDSEEVTTFDEVMVWIAAHELWHFLCKTKQEKYNYQTRANKFGFLWLREFKLWMKERSQDED